MEYSQQISNIFHSVLDSFDKDVISTKFGLKNLTRADLLNENSNIATKIHGTDKLILICDGTYIRHKKSTNNEYQRKSYSGQEKVPLCKPFTICTSNGFIVDMLGPYLANKNDASILLEILKDSSYPLKLFFQKEDILIVDRGFRDAISVLNDLGIHVLMPALKGKRSQLTTKEANDSRYVTKLRWVVEAVHGLIKQKFKLLDRKLDNKMLPQTGRLMRIASYLHNVYSAKLNSEVKENRLRRRKLAFKNISSEDLLDFPELTENDLVLLFSGTYQMKQSMSYLAEMIDANNQLKILYCKASDNVIRLSVPSRHKNRQSYKCFINYAKDSAGHEAIKKYCCDCPNGNRTVGCCSHVAAIIVYLSWARYLDKIVKPAEFLSKFVSKIIQQLQYV